MKSFLWVLLLLLVLPAGLAEAQWNGDDAAFLEPNQFWVAKSIENPELWLGVGYGAPFAQIGGVKVGLEGLVWSRLRSLSDFRFPVETADYFFGGFGTWSDASGSWRARLSHISSHLVDGTDSAVIGGSSSKYSREFVELDRQQTLWRSVEVTYGIRCIFHQVTVIEPVLSVPISILWSATSSTAPFGVGLWLSTAASPVWPSMAAGIKLSHPFGMVSRTDLDFSYHYGASIAGTDRGVRSGDVLVQLTLRPF